MVQAGVRFSGRVQIKTNKIPMEIQTVETKLILNCIICGKETSLNYELGPMCLGCIKSFESNNEEECGSLIPDIEERLAKIEIKNGTKEITIADILERVSYYTKVPEDKIGEKTNKREIVVARQIAQAIARHTTTLSLSQIGAQIGNKDHATILHSCKTVINIFNTNRPFREKFTPLFEEYFIMSIFDKTIKHEKIYRRPNNL